MKLTVGQTEKLKYIIRFTARRLFVRVFDLVESYCTSKFNFKCFKKFYLFFKFYLYTKDE